jgi:uncharacterized FlaG/YvyC family protein
MKRSFSALTNGNNPTPGGSLIRSASLSKLKISTNYRKVQDQLATIQELINKNVVKIATDVNLTNTDSFSRVINHQAI